MFRWILLLFVLIFTIPAHATQPTIVKLTEGVYGFIGIDGATNSGFIVTEEGVVVIDTQGPKELALLLKRKIQEVTDKPVIYVINTHYHGDHTFGNQHFKEAREIIAHENTRKNLTERDKPHKEQFKRFFGEKALEGIEVVLPTKTFKDTLSMRIGNKVFELVYLGVGHTDGDIIVYLPLDGIIFTGDLLYTGRLPWVGDGNIQSWREVLKKIGWFEASTYIPGHGRVTNKNGLNEFKNYLDDLTNEVARMIREGKDLETVMKEINLPKYKDWLKYNDWLGLNAKKVFEELTANILPYRLMVRVVAIWPSKDGTSSRLFFRSTLISAGVVRPLLTTETFISGLIRYIVPPVKLEM
ncbi:MAG: MBL fold metallo-hydrolase [Deltaproteobacteria bacterium]|nr:MBL fold metallo-hydrolase [Deltaproteobacteria bacterium]